MRRSWKSVGLICAVLVAVAASIAVAAPRDEGEERDRTPHGAGEARFGPGGFLSSLADELGVSRDRLEAAFRAVRDEVGPPDRRGREAFEARCRELTDALGRELDKSGNEVRDAFRAVARRKIESAVDANHLTRRQADRILERLESSDCAGPPPFFALGLHGPGGPPPFGLRGGIDREEIEDRCREHTDALAEKLGTSGARVRDALKELAKERIEEAVDDGDLTRREANRIIRRIDSADCAGGPLAFGGPGPHHRFGGRGFHGPPGFGPPGGRDRMPGESNGDSRPGSFGLPGGPPEGVERGLFRSELR